MVDDFHGEREWRDFMTGVNKIYPGAVWIELEDTHPAFHVVYDLTKRVQIPGANVVHGPGYERGGVVPHWRGILDKDGPRNHCNLVQHGHWGRMGVCG